MTKSILYRGAAALALGAALAPAYVAQAQDYTSGGVTGQVLDASGNALVGATISLTSVDRGFTRTATSGANGAFRFPNLPIGSYDVEASAAGFESFAGQTSVSVGSARDVTFTLVPAGASRETIVVTGVQQGSFDFDQTTTGLTLDVDELTLRTPVTRDLQSIALLTPGAGIGDTAFTSGFQAGGRTTQISIAGSSIGENVYYVNGMNVSDFVNFLGASTVPFEFYDQLEVKVGGYPAEFGRSTGGIINAVTKSGSNEFEYGFNAFWTPDGLRSDAPDTFAQLNNMDERDEYDLNIYASGPIIPNRLFFYGLYNPRSNERTDTNAAGRVRTTEETNPFFGLKLDGVITDDHLLEFTYWNNEFDSEQTDVNAAGVSKGTGIYTSGGDNYIGKYTGSFTSWLTASLLYGVNKSAIAATSERADTFTVREAAGRTDLDFDLTPLLLLRGGDYEREMIRGDVDVYAEFLGSHHFRAGFDREMLTVNDDQFYSGPSITLPTIASMRGAVADATSPTGFSITSPGGLVQVQTPLANGDGRYRVRNRVVSGGYDSEQSAFYIQDSWNPVPSLTLNLGVRRESFVNKTLSGAEYADFDTTAPRFGFVWDPGSTGKNKLYGSWGEYYIPVAANTSIRLGGNERDLRPNYRVPYSAALDLDGSGALDPEEVVDPTTGLPYGFIDPANYRSNAIFSDGVEKDTVELVDANLEPQYMEEYILGFERSFGDEFAPLKDWTLGARYLNRQLKRGLEDAAVDAGVLAWCTANGVSDCDTVYSGFHAYILTNPGNTIQFSTDDLEGLPGAPSGFVDITLTPDLLPYPPVERTYEAFEFTWERPWDGLWSVQGSYTNSWLKGNYEGSVKSDNGQTDAGLTTDFDQPGLVDGSLGLLPQHRRHRMKLWGAYALADNITLGSNIQVESPREFGCLGVHPTDFFASLYGVASWYCQGELTPRASQIEGDWLTKVDLSAAWSPQVDYGDLRFSVDVFNIFDTAGAIDLYERGDTSSGSVDPDYGSPLSYQSPRSVRFGVSFKR